MLLLKLGEKRIASSGRGRGGNLDRLQHRGRVEPFLTANFDCLDQVGERRGGCPKASRRLAILALLDPVCHSPQGVSDLADEAQLPTFVAGGAAEFIESGSYRHLNIQLWVIPGSGIGHRLFESLSEPVIP